MTSTPELAIAAVSRRDYDPNGHAHTIVLSSDAYRSPEWADLDAVPGGVYAAAWLPETSDTWQPLTDLADLPDTAEAVRFTLTDDTAPEGAATVVLRPATPADEPTPAPKARRDPLAVAAAVAAALTGALAVTAIALHVWEAATPGLHPVAFHTDQRAVIADNLALWAAAAFTLAMAAGYIAAARRVHQAEDAAVRAEFRALIAAYRADRAETRADDAEARAARAEARTV